MPDLSTVILSDDHPISECWNPQYHRSPFNSKSATIFRRWYEREFTEGEYDFRRAAPLCIFGGVQFNVYVLNEHAAGTYAVCPTCEKVLSCGYNDDSGLSPKSCYECNAQLDLNDYFQPVFLSSSVQEEDLINPSCDPAVTIAETCALSPEGIPSGVLGAIIAILTDEGLLETGEFVDDLRIQNNRVESKSVGKRTGLLFPTWTYVEPSSRRFCVEVIDSGRIMLEARSIVPKDGSQERVSELLSLELEPLQALAWKALANRIG